MPQGFRCPGCNYVIHALRLNGFGGYEFQPPSHCPNCGVSLVSQQLKVVTNGQCPKDACVVCWRTMDNPPQLVASGKRVVEKRPYYDPTAEPTLGDIFEGFLEIFGFGIEKTVYQTWKCPKCGNTFEDFGTVL